MNSRPAHIISRVKKLCVLAGVLAIAAPAFACPIPVYQYSLEWWESDPYEIYVFDNGELTDEEQAAIDKLKRISEGGEDNVPANLRLRTVQSDDEERLKAHSALRGENPDSFPWMAVYYPSISSNVRTPVWMGPLNEENLDALLDSPARQEITEALVDRTSVVWVLLESGNSSSDNEAYSLLERETKRLEETLVKPDLAEWGMDDIPITDIKFKTMRVSRDDEAERMFVRMLMNSEVDLEDYVDEPMVFPIFGRGLVMEALIGRGINRHMILDTAEFLTGPCSCTVKSLNPGTDLLTSVAWDDRIEPYSEEWDDAEPGGLGGFMDSADQIESF